MNTAALKDYAPQARKDFIAAVTAQAKRIGITAKGTAKAEVQGDVLLIDGQAFSKDIANPRNTLAERVNDRGFEQVMEAAAYTWFNRFMALRYMELHGYFDHGYRVLSHPEGEGRPEILDHVSDLELPGLDKDHLLELKLDGSKDEELYRLIFKAQCNALHQAMPFLFEKLGAADELLLPANLLHSDSLIRQLVESIDEDLWQDIEIVGWLYQFYISEKKDQVIGSVVKSEDIPAATQLFTPNWIVKYMVQNSLGAQWLATYPDSPLKGQMEYYIEPAEQTDEVNAQLAAITPKELNPEELTLIDPASGSGHILVEAYELFKAIYLERGYRQRDVPQLILEKNLFGLDIDERAAQLTGFALMMKARADDRRLFEREVKLQVMALVDSKAFDAEGLSKGVELSDYGLEPEDLRSLKDLFEHATTFGSLIQVPEELVSNLTALKQLSEVTSQGLFVSESLMRLGPLVQQAELLAAQYDAVVVNPPYMGRTGMNSLVKDFTKDDYPEAKDNLFACFVERGFMLARELGCISMVTMQSWMFLSSFQDIRERVLRDRSILTMAHLGARAFASISGEVVQTTAFALRNCAAPGYRPVFFRLVDGNEDEKREALINGNLRFDTIEEGEFGKIPGSPLAYWLSKRVLETFELPKLGRRVTTEGQNKTADNDRFLRLSWELPVTSIGRGNRWIFYAKGGPFRKWFGNVDCVVDWTDRAVDHYRKSSRCRIVDERFWFQPAVTWTDITSGGTSFRYMPGIGTFDMSGPTAFFSGEEEIWSALGLLNSVYASALLPVLNPTLHAQLRDIKAIPTPHSQVDCSQIETLVHLSRDDWNAYERSWDFQSLPLLTAGTDLTPTLESSYTAWVTQNRDTIAEMKRLEEENNRLFINAYGLEDELTPDVPMEQITLTVNPAYRYGVKLTDEEQWTRFRQDTMEELVSYAIGCMMGRYSLDQAGLMYAHSGNEGFDPSQYTTFPADDDGIVPLTDTEWFDDDATHRMIEFMTEAWPKAHLEENLTFLAENLSPKKGESSRETIRRYLCDKLFKDHLKTHKKRPIYWLFTSGKQKAFQCLVYLHRYNEGTLSRMRSEYVIPLQGKMAARLDKLKGDIQAATSTAQSKRLDKERAKLEKQHHELLAFDEKLRHYADLRIKIDLDDGVKVNYGKFGDLLAEVTKIHGKKPEVA